MLLLYCSQYAAAVYCLSVLWQSPAKSQFFHITHYYTTAPCRVLSSWVEKRAATGGCKQIEAACTSLGMQWCLCQHMVITCLPGWCVTVKLGDAIVNCIHSLHKVLVHLQTAHDNTQLQVQAAASNSSTHTSSGQQAYHEATDRMHMLDLLFWWGSCSKERPQSQAAGCQLAAGHTACVMFMLCALVHNSSLLSLARAVSHKGSMPRVWGIRITAGQV
jgi:hypothetical protein